MGSLTAHLLEPGDHGGLPFHPSCPVCRRERLSGTLSTEPVVSRRTQALIAGGVLAVSAGSPGFAVAAGPDRQAEGVAAPEDPSVGELHDPDFDPGGETPLPFETAPAPTDTPDDDGAGAPIDAEPVDDPDGRLMPPVADDGAPADEEASPVGGDMSPTTGNEPSGVTETTATPPPSIPPPVPEDVTTPDSPPTASPRETERRDSANPREQKRRAPEEPPSVQAPAPSPIPAVEPDLTVSAVQPASTTAAPAATGGERSSSLRNAERYVVQPGDSLWSIAKRRVGIEASPARIAREVDRLWSLNKERIATGDPDLLMVGTRLTLR